MIWPLSCGKLNVQPEPGYTVTSLLRSLEVLWASAIDSHLNIKKEELKVGPVEYTANIVILATSIIALPPPPPPSVALPPHPLPLSLSTSLSLPPSLR